MSALHDNAESSWLRHDRRLCRAANRWTERRLILRGFGLISRLGDGVVWYVLMAVLLVAGGERGAWASLHMAAVGLVACALYRHLKRWTRRPRPFRHDASIVARIAPLDEFSFPSGHTLHAVTFSLVAIAYFPVLALLLVPLTLLIAASRVVLGLHYPSDVLAATAIGWLLAGTSLWLVPGVDLIG